MRGLGLACWGQVNAMGTLMGTVLLTVALFDTRLNWDVFSAWLITQHLLAKIAVGAVIVMDNVSIHKRPDMLEPTRGKQC